MEILKARLSSIRNSDILFLLGRGDKTWNYQLANEYIDKALSVNTDGVADMLITAGQDYLEQNEFQRALEFLTLPSTMRKKISLLDDIAFVLKSLTGQKRA